MMENNNELQLYGIPYNQVDQVWPEIVPILDKVIPYTYGNYTAEDIREGIEDRSMQLWISTRKGKPSTIMVTKIIKYPQKKVLLIMLYAGESLTENLKFKETIYEWGRSHGCHEVQLYGRMGWEKILKDQGFEKIHTVLRCSL